VPSTVEEALRAAVVLAVEAGEYERAGEVLSLLRRTAGDPAAATGLGSS
jgi:hypothetical protein